MGYTHYWTPKKQSAKKFKNFSETCKKLHDNLPEKSETAGGYCSDEKIEIGNWEGHLGMDNHPVFDNDVVSFNGVGENGHETFRTALNENDWRFCKTARKPYDLLVCACLLASIHILNYEISSDGNVVDWTTAIEYYNKVMKNDNLTSKDLKNLDI
ncbi:MAG: hypothetical protein PF487_01105 [Bacteroidales bacterium]|jgi:hypothetical protein|nr:hypothetical protein [Bacteroidales bacterium]